MFKKRVFAIMIDYFIIAILVGTISSIIPYNQFLFFAITFVLFSIKDIVCRNASIGKKIMKLKVVTKNNEIPPLKSLVLRNVILIFLSAIAIVQLNQSSSHIGDDLTGTKVVSSSEPNI